VLVALAVKLEHGAGWTRDVSASGVFFTTQGSFFPGAPVRFVLELEHVDPAGVVHVTCEGKVVRVEPLSQAIGLAVHILSYEFGRRQSWDGIP
jgi:hypothetical protein